MKNDVLKEAVRINRDIYDIEHYLKDMDNVMQGDVKIEVDVLNGKDKCKCILFDDDPVVGENFGKRCGCTCEEAGKVEQEIGHIET